MNKRAGVPDGIFYMVAIFAIAIISIIGFVILDKLNTNFQDSSSITPVGKTLIEDQKNNYVKIIDNAFLMIFVGVLIGTLAGVWFIRTHPALFWITIPIFAFIIFLSAIYANVFWNFTNNASIIEAASQFTIIPFIMERYAYVMTGVVVLIAIALFAKGKTETIL